MKKRKLFLTGLLLSIFVASSPCNAAYASELENEKIEETMDAGSMVSSEESSTSSEASDESSEAASEEEKELSLEERLEVAKSSVVQINCVLTDKDDKKHIIKGTPGTLIGKADGTEYVITGLNAVTPSKELKNSTFKSLKIKKDEWDNQKLSYEVVVQNDMVFGAEILNSSEELDLAVFKLSQVLNQRKPMKILFSENGRDLPGVGEVYAYGFPDAIEFGKNETYYPNDRVNRTSGKISNIVNEGDVEWIEHNAAISANNNGGPLITENGEMIGINSHKTEGTYYYAVSSNSIVKILDGLGLEYDKISVEEKKRIEEEKEKDAASKAMSNIPVEPEYVPATVPGWLVGIIVILFILVAFVLVAVMLLFKKNSNKPSFKERRRIKKEEKEKQITPEEFDNRRTNAKSEKIEKKTSDAAEGTSVLSTSGSGETSVLSGGTSSVSQGIYGTMVRKSYGENIIINKNRFVIGKDSAHVDYCVKNNGAISRQHAAIKTSGGTVYVEDLGSTNGTFLNGTKLNNGTPQQLNDGDIVKLADEEFEFRK